MGTDLAHISFSYLPFSNLAGSAQQLGHIGHRRRRAGTQLGQYGLAFGIVLAQFRDHFPKAIKAGMAQPLTQSIIL
jgi:hypothetical protein